MSCLYYNVYDSATHQDKPQSTVEALHHLVQIRLRFYLSAYICCLYLLLIFAAYICCLYLLLIFAAYICCLYLLLIFAAYICGGVLLCGGVW